MSHLISHEERPVFYFNVEVILPAVRSIPGHPITFSPTVICPKNWLRWKHSYIFQDLQAACAHFTTVLSSWWFSNRTMAITHPQPLHFEVSLNSGCVKHMLFCSLEGFSLFSRCLTSWMWPSGWKMSFLSSSCIKPSVFRITPTWICSVTSRNVAHSSSRLTVR